MQVNLYEETVTIQVHGEDGGEPEHLTTRRQRARVDDYTAYPVVRTKVVSAEEIAYRFAGNIDLRTGVLQEDTLWVVKNGGGKQTAIWRPPQVWEVKQIAAFGAEPVVYRLPMPGLVFLCGEDGRDPHVFAARRRPEREDEELYRCPAFNIFDNGRICQGSGQAWPRRESHVPEVFFHTYFTRDGHTRNRSQRHPERLDELWREIDGRQAYPLDDLVRQFTVADAMLLRTR